MYSFDKLNNKEKIFKEIYLNGGEKYLQMPMSMLDFGQIVEKYPKLQHVYTFINERTEGQYGKTVVISDDDWVGVSRNERYSFPIIHNHSYFEVIYVYKGTAVHYVENETMTLNEGDICILAPNTMHAVNAPSDDAIVFAFMLSKKNFDRSFIKLLRGDRIQSEFFENILYNGMASPYIIFPTGNDSTIQKLSLNIFLEVERKDYEYKEMIQLYIRQLFIHLIRNYQMMAVVTDPVSQSKEDNVSSMLGYLSMNYMNVSLKEMADFFHYSESHLGRNLKKYTGKNFGQLVSQMQIEEAKRLLKMDELNVAKIAQRVGCFDASHFVRKFKKETGMTPEEFKASENNIN